jgi:hypothetical protein
MEFKGDFAFLLPFSFFVGLVVLLQSLLSENTEEFINKLIILRQSFFPAYVHSRQGVERLYLNQFLPKLCKKYLNIMTIE